MFAQDLTDVEHSIQSALSRQDSYKRNLDTLQSNSQRLQEEYDNRENKIETLKLNVESRRSELTQMLELNDALARSMNVMLSGIASIRSAASNKEFSGKESLRHTQFNIDRQRTISNAVEALITKLINLSLCKTAINNKLACKINNNMYDICDFNFLNFNIL